MGHLATAQTRGNLRSIPLPNPAVIAQVEDELRRRRAERAEKSLFEFVKQAWSVVEPGVPFVVSWHIEAICEHLQAVTDGEIRRLLINIPPRHSKSIIVSVMWPMWEWITLPHEKYLCGSYSGILSIRDNLKSRRLVQSAWYQACWGDRFILSGDQNAKQRFENSKTGYRIATSVGGTATGEGGSRLILDDGISAQDAQSDAIRESTLEWLDMAWSTRLNDPKRDAMVEIAQRTHEDDPSGHRLMQGGWEHVCIPAEYDGVRRKTILGEYDPRTKIGELICPDRFGPKEIDELKLQLGEYGSAGQLQQIPSPAGGGILKVDHFQLWPAGKSLPPLEYVLQSYDGAYTMATAGDPTACSVYGVFKWGGRYCVAVVDAWSEKIPYPKLRPKVIDDWNASYGGDTKDPFNKPRRPDQVLIENKASGIALIQDLHQANVPVFCYNPGNADHIARAHQIAPVLELDCIYLVESTILPGQPTQWVRAFKEQLERFPNATHDDYVDTFSQAIAYLKDLGWFDLKSVPEEVPETYDYYAAKHRRVNPYAC